VKAGGVNVFAGSEQSGRLERSEVDEDTTLFTYRRGCPASAAVSLSTSVRTQPYDAMAGLLPIFDMNLPQGLLRDHLSRRFAKGRGGVDDLDLLSIAGASQIGRLRYSGVQELRGEVPAEDLDEILAYQGASDLFTRLLERYAQYSGISGAQPKVLVRAQDAQNAHGGASHIVKAFDEAAYPELAANELLCTEGAAAAGMATTRLQMSIDRRLLVAERFDRAANGEHLGMEDFCVLDGRRSHGRYDGSYENIARLINAFVSPAALEQAREQYCLMVAYACTIENGDAHLKNFSVLYESPVAEVRLAPCYDMISTTPYLPRDSLALTLAGTKQFPARGELLTFIMAVMACAPDRAAALLEQVAHGAAVVIAKAAAYGRQHRDARPFADRLTAAITRGLQRLTAATRYSRAPRRPMP
jgi:serine/threonine-protein kinase HipA